MSDSKRDLFTLSHIISLPISVLSRLRFTSWSSLLSLFNWPPVKLCLNVPNCLIYFGFIECLCIHLFWQVFVGNSRVTQNWVTNSSYAWFSFLKKTHANIFCSRFFMWNSFFVRSLENWEPEKNVKSWQFLQKPLGKVTNISHSPS